MEPILGDTRFTEGRIEIFRESGWVETINTIRATQHMSNMTKVLYKITKNSLRKYHNINVSKDRLSKYINNNQPPETSHILHTDEQNQQRLYIHKLFIDLNAYCKISNRPKLGGMCNYDFYLPHHTDIEYETRPPFENIGSEETFRIEFMLDVNSPEDG